MAEGKRPEDEVVRGWIVIITVILMGMVAGNAEGKYGGGSGTPEDPYQIRDANHMQAIGADSNDWDKCFKLMADIDLRVFDGKDGREEFNIIAPDTNDAKPRFQGTAFTGIFDGNGHAISNFIYDSNERDYIGLFGCVRGEIKDLDLLDPNINAGNGNYVGSIAGHLQSEIISNCRVKGGSVCGGDSVGGVVGISYGDSGQSIIRQCHSDTTVSGRDFVGGLAGEYDHYKVISSIEDSSATGDVFATGNYTGGLVGWKCCGRISNCYSTGSVSGFFCVGGLMGYNAGSIISNCYSTATVSGAWRVGGLVGYHDGKITYSYSVGSVSGAYEVGGLVGYNFWIVMACFWDIETSGEPNMCGYDGDGCCDPNYGKTTAEMKQQSTFKGWDFINVWGIGENQTYPYLRRYLAGDINKDGIVNFKDFAIVALKWLEEYNVGNRAPEVVITYPEDGARLMVGGVPPQTLITAEAEDSDGTVVRVEFFDGEMKLGEDTDGSDGWSYLWTEYSLGWHTLTAVAWDEEGLPGVSVPVTVEVWMPDPPPP
jgi:hypothetical protein